MQQSNNNRNNNTLFNGATTSAAPNKLAREAKAAQKRLMLEALERTMGIVTPALKRTGTAWSTHWKWMRDDARYAGAVAEIAEAAKDFVETQMFKRIQEGSDQMITFYARTKMRDRGYGEHTTTDTTNSGEVTLKIVRG